jgi:hypothetical protein
VAGHGHVEAATAAGYPYPADAGRLVAWATAMLAGRVEIGQAAVAVETGSHGHVVGSLPDLGESCDAGGPGCPDPPNARASAEQSMLAAIGWLRRARPTRVALLLPTFGDPLGLHGDSPLARAAVEAGAAVAFEAHGHGFGWVPHADLRGSSYRGVRWQHLPGGTNIPAPTLDPTRIIEQADRALRRALRTATETLFDVDLAQWRPEVAEGRHAADTALRTRLRPMPPDWPLPAAQLGERALALWRVVGIAAADPGAVSASGAAVRAEVVRALSRAVREAAMAAFNVPAAALLGSLTA